MTENDRKRLENLASEIEYAAQDLLTSAMEYIHDLEMQISHQDDLILDLRDEILERDAVIHSMREVA